MIKRWYKSFKIYLNVVKHAQQLDKQMQAALHVAQEAVNQNTILQQHNAALLNELNLIRSAYPVLNHQTLINITNTLPSVEKISGDLFVYEHDVQGIRYNLAFRKAQILTVSSTGQKRVNEQWVLSDNLYIL